MSPASCKKRYESQGEILMEQKEEKGSNLTNAEIISLKILTRLTLQENIDEEIIDLLRELQLEYYSLLKKYEIMEERVNIDEKTSLLKYNEKFLVNIVKAISRYWQSSQKRHVLPITYLRLDLDDFSRINNRYGHDFGDKVLIEVAKRLKNHSRPTDYIFRFGGEEFDIVLPVTNTEGAKVYAGKILESIREIRIPFNLTETIKITASMGISSFKMDFKKNIPVINKRILKYYNEVQKQADCACYEAKYLGKDRACFYREDADYESIMKEYSSKN